MSLVSRSKIAVLVIQLADLLKGSDNIIGFNKLGI
jgi:hypothetical protein